MGDKILGWTKGRPYLASALLVSAFLALQAILFKPFYLVNDDVFMEWMVRGIGCFPKPDAHLVFSPYLFGLILKDLYGLAGRVPWYVLSLIAAQFLGSWALLASLLLRKPARPGAAIAFWLVFQAAFGVFCFARPTFTTTSVLAFLGGFLLLQHRVRSEKTRVLEWGTLLATICLLSSFLIRAHSFYQAFVLSLPFVFIEGVPRPLGAKWAKFLLVLGSILLLLWAWDREAYDRGDAWTGVKGHNSLIWRCHDCLQPEYNETTRPLFESMGWSRNDLELFKSWYFWDADRYGVVPLRILADGIGPSGLAWKVPATLAWLSHDLRFLLWLPLLLGALGMAARERRAALLAAYGWMAAVLVGLMWLTRTPDRVYLSAFGFVFSGALAFGVDRRQGDHGSRWKRGASLGLLALMAMAAGTMAFLQHGQNSRMARNEGALCREIWRLDPQGGRLLVIWDSSFPYEAVSPFNPEDPYASVRVFPFAPFQITPGARERLKRSGLENPLRDMVDRRDVSLICNGEQANLALGYILEKFHRRIWAVQSGDRPQFQVFQLLSRPPRLSSGNDSGSLDGKVPNP